MPRISIVTPTFQQGGTIRQTIESVLGQEDVDLDYWVMDAGSQDGTVDILRDYEGDPRFHWISKPDGGQSTAIDNGLRLCTGEVFNWINSDDYLEPGALSRVSEIFDSSPGLHIVSGRTAEFRGDPPAIFNHVQLQVRARAEQTITVGVFCQPSTFWRTDVFRELGGVDPTLHHVMDWDLWVRYLARHGQAQVRRVSDIFAHYRHHAASKTSVSSDQFYEEAKVVFHRLNTSLNAPEAFLFREASAQAMPSTTEYTLGPTFDRERYLGCFAERMVRTLRREDPALARTWLNRAWSYKPRFTFWRAKMALRLLFR